ncbi:hypothetical protein ACYOEI_01685 [Singulisphaera rosea]
MPDPLFNKYRAAIEVLHRGRESLVNDLAEEIIDQGDELIEGGYIFNEFLETQGTRLHFLCLLVNQLEVSAENLDETLTAPPPKPAVKRRPRTKKLPRQTSKEGTTEEA